MSFDTHRGTRGAWQPKGRILRWVNAMMVRRVRRRAGSRMMGFNVLILTTVGRHTGRERTTPVGWFPGGDGSWLIAASANGAVNNPAWYYNIAAHPDEVRIEVDGRAIAVTAEQLHGAERSAAWQQITTSARNFAQYATRTDREIPVIRLRPRGEPGDRGR